MHLLIRTDGRTERHVGLDPYDERGAAHRSLSETVDFGPSFTREQTLPIRMPASASVDPFTLWVGEPTITQGVGLRNIPAAILAGQWGIPVRLLSGPVVVTSAGSAASAFVENGRWGYVESLVDDIVRALHGQPCSKYVVDRAWAPAVLLAGAVLESSQRPLAVDLHGDEAVAYLLSEFGLPVLAEGGQ